MKSAYSDANSITASRNMEPSVPFENAGTKLTQTTFSVLANKSLEARVGIEPTRKGFADLSLTTWVPRLTGSVSYRVLRGNLPLQSTAVPCAPARGTPGVGPNPDPMRSLRPVHQARSSISVPASRFPFTIQRPSDVPVAACEFVCFAGRKSSGMANHTE